MTSWLIDKSALARRASSPDAAAWASITLSRIRVKVAACAYCGATADQRKNALDHSLVAPVNG